jgi:hypothetical protein
MNNRPQRALLPAFLLFVAFACSKKISTPLPYLASGSALMLEEIDFDYLDSKARMVLKDASKEREVKAHIRVRKDSVIWMNFSVIGVQGGRALINHDSITIYNNVEKEYYVFNYDELSKKFNLEVNYSLIQSAMLGNLLIPKQETDSVELRGTTFLLRQSNGPVDVLNYISALSMKLQKVELKENNTHNSLTLSYGNFQPVGNKIFPFNCTINLFYQAPGGLLNTTIIFEYTKAEVGTKELRFPFNIPKKYERR